MVNKHHHMAEMTTHPHLMVEEPRTLVVMTMRRLRMVSKHPHMVNETITRLLVMGLRVVMIMRRVPGMVEDAMAVITRIARSLLMVRNVRPEGMVRKRVRAMDVEITKFLNLVSLLL